MLPECSCQSSSNILYPQSQKNDYHPSTRIDSSLLPTPGEKIYLNNISSTIAASPFVDKRITNCVAPKVAVKFHEDFHLSISVKERAKKIEENLDDKCNQLPLLLSKKQDSTQNSIFERKIKKEESFKERKKKTELFFENFPLEKDLNNNSKDIISYRPLKSLDSKGEISLEKARRTESFLLSAHRCEQKIKDATKAESRKESTILELKKISKNSNNTKKVYSYNLVHHRWNSDSKKQSVEKEISNKTFEEVKYSKSSSALFENERTKEIRKLLEKWQEKLQASKNEKGKNLPVFIRKLSRWHARLIKLRDECSYNTGESSRKEITELIDEIDSIGKYCVCKLFNKFFQGIVVLSVYAISASIISESPRALYWINSVDPMLINKLKVQFTDTLWTCFDFAIHDTQKESRTYPKIVELLLDTRDVCQTFSFNWTEYQTEIFKKYKALWTIKKNKLSPPPLIIQVDHLLQRSSKDLLKEEREKIAYSLAYTLFNIRIDQFSCLKDEQIQELSESKNINEHLKNTISFSEAISNFVKYSILSTHSSTQARAHLFDTFIATSLKLLELHDVESAGAIYLGLSNPVISYLKKTQKLCSKNTLSAFEMLSTLFSLGNNLKNYRSYIQNSKSLTIFPYFAVIFKDLEFARVGNRGSVFLQWKKEIGRALISCIYYSKLEKIYQESMGEAIIPVTDLKTTLDEGKFIFTRSELTLFNISKQLEGNE